MVTAVDRLRMTCSINMYITLCIIYQTDTLRQAMTLLLLYLGAINSFTLYINKHLVYTFSLVIVFFYFNILNLLFSGMLKWLAHLVMLALVFVCFELFTMEFYATQFAFYMTPVGKYTCSSWLLIASEPIPSQTLGLSRACTFFQKLIDLEF